MGHQRCCTARKEVYNFHTSRCFCCRQTLRDWCRLRWLTYPKPPVFLLGHCWRFNLGRGLCPGRRNPCQGSLLRRLRSILRDQLLRVSPLPPGHHSHRTTPSCPPFIGPCLCRGLQCGPPLPGGDRVPSAQISSGPRLRCTAGSEARGVRLPRVTVTTLGMDAPWMHLIPALPLIRPGITRARCLPA
jgi:hypothetical protein